MDVPFFDITIENEIHILGGNLVNNGRIVLVGLIVALVLCICGTVLGTMAIIIQLPSNRPVIGMGQVSTVAPPTLPASAKSSAVSSATSSSKASLPSSSSASSPIVAATLTSSFPTADALLRTDIPERDLYAIVPRLRKNLALLTPVPTMTPRTYKVGDTDKFFVIENASSGSYRTVVATLQAATPNSFFWVENGMSFDSVALQKSAELFEKTILPTNQKYFGLQLAGISGDTRVHILNTKFEDAAGYFSSEDTFPRSLAPFGNQRNIIYMNIEAVKLNSDEYNGDLAHEFQHLIHSYEAEHKTGWIDEGMADLAIKVNGYPVFGLDSFARRPGTQLNTWANEDPQLIFAHYAGSYLFFNYTALRFGPEFTRAVIHAPSEGVNGVQAVLDQRVKGMKFEDLFADWAVTNYLNDPSIENGKYAYSNETNFRITREPVLNQVPVVRSETMSEYATSYFGIQPSSGGVTIIFTGTMTTKLIAANAHAGKWMWYSNRADLSNMNLTREFDLSSVKQATLKFWTWYDIEQGFDYAYVQASTDSGKTWDVLPGKHTTTENPNGSSYGPAFSGHSGSPNGKSAAQWVEEQVNLSAYAGKKILVRFEYITDDAYNAPGFAVDDISIPEINFVDGMESGENGWQAKGFVRIDNVLPQKFIVQVVSKGAATQVQRVPLDALNRGKITIDGFGKEVTRAELIVNAFAPTTTELTQFEFAVLPK